MLDWKKMENTWTMLPQNVKNCVMFDGLIDQKPVNNPELGATNLSGASPQIIDMQIDQNQWCQTEK